MCVCINFHCFVDVSTVHQLRNQTYGVLQLSTAIKFSVTCVMVCLVKRNCFSSCSQDSRRMKWFC